MTIIDELQEGACLPKAQFWSISSDVGILTRTKSTNRWRLPPATSDIPQSAVIDNATSAAQSVLFAAENMGIKALAEEQNDDVNKNNTKKSDQEKQRDLDEMVHICVVCSSGEAGGEAGTLFVKELFKSKNIASEKKTRFPGRKTGFSGGKARFSGQKTWVSGRKTRLSGRTTRFFGQKTWTKT